jgi:hypothetical protein
VAEVWSGVKGQHGDNVTALKVRDEVDKREPTKRKRRAAGVTHALNVLRGIAITIDSAEAAVDMGSLGDLEQIVAQPEAPELIDRVDDGTRRLRAHIRTLRRYQKEAEATTP